VSIGHSFVSQTNEVPLAAPVGITEVLADLDHFINLLIEENPESFAFNKGLWKLTMDFKFGDTEVSLSPSLCLTKCLALGPGLVLWPGLVVG
jgi:hypothetical protein